MKAIAGEMTDAERERRLMAYMTGFRMGVNAAALVEIDRADDDLMDGYGAGREAKKTAYVAASEHYGAILSPFRGGP